MLNTLLTNKGFRALLASALIVPLAAQAEATSKPNSDVVAAQQVLQVQSSALRSPEAKAVSNAMADMGLELQRKQATPDKNTTTSPFSLMSAWGLVLNGAAGKTQTALTTALHLKGLSTEQFNRGYQSITTSLRNISRDNTLSFGNAIFADRDFQVRDTYSRAVSRALGASAQTVNFDQPKEAADSINGYIAKQTHDMIKNMVDAQSVEGWRVALVNAGYYKGAWAFNFDEKYTDEKGDYFSGRAKKQIPMMRQYGKHYLYYKGDGFQMATLAYKNADFAMDLIVPDKGRDGDVRAPLAATAKQFTGEHYRKWIAGETPRLIFLSMPRFEVEYKENLTQYFRGLMPLAFSDNADFSLISPEPIKIDQVIHATVLKVNEEGTEGSFATVIGAVRATAVERPVPIPQVVADRPFMMVIRHVATGTPVFVSTVWDPKPLPKPKH